MRLWDDYENENGVHYRTGESIHTVLTAPFHWIRLHEHVAIQRFAQMIQYPLQDAIQIPAQAVLLFPLPSFVHPPSPSTDSNKSPYQLYQYHEYQCLYPRYNNSEQFIQLNTLQTVYH